MEFLLELQNKWGLDFVIILIVLLSGFFQAKYLPIKVFVKDQGYDKALKTLAVSLIVSTIWIILAQKEMEGEIPFAKYFLSYFAATSLYELLVKPLVKWIQKFTGSEVMPTQ